MPSILIADDEAEVRQFLKTVLQDCGHRVWEASNGEEAAAQIHRRKFDLVIIDLVMPEREGLQMIQALRNEYPALKIIAMSGPFHGVYLDAVLRMAERMGANASLPKPLSTDTVLERVQRVLDLA